MKEMRVESDGFQAKPACQQTKHPCELNAVNRKIFLFAAGACILIWVAWSNWGGLLAALDRLDPLMATVSLTVLTAANICLALLFSVLAKREGARETSRAALVGSYLVSQAAKYVPGKIWSVILQRLYLGNHVSSLSLVITNVEIAFVGIMVAFVVGVSLHLALLDPWIATAFGGFGLTAIHILSVVGWVGRLARKLASLLHAGEIVLAAAVPGGRVDSKQAVMFGLIAIFAGAYAAGWLLLSGPAISSSLEQALGLVSTMALSYAIGALSMVPAGLGVRELAMVLMGNATDVDPTLVASVALVSRAMLIALDVVSTVLGGLLLMLAKSKGAAR